MEHQQVSENNLRGKTQPEGENRKSPESCLQVSRSQSVIPLMFINEGTKNYGVTSVGTKVCK